MTLGKMGLRKMMLGRKWNPYVTDGLVAMWDGIWNAGGGRHTDDVAAIVPIVGTRRSLSSDFIVHPDGLYNATLNNMSRMVIDLAAPVVDIGTGPDGGSTIELVMGCNEYRSDNKGSFVLGTPWTSTTKWEFYAWPVSSTPHVYILSGNVSWDTDVRFVADGVVRSHVARRVYSGTSNLTYWRNGAMQKSSTQSGRTQITYTQIAFGLGGFTGILKAVRVYGRPLTAAEIAANYAIDKARFNLP
jgi:hypothetical protein